MTQLEKPHKIWQQDEWPYFTWDSTALLDKLVQLRFKQGKLLALHTSPEPEPLVKQLPPIEKDIFENYLKPLNKERLLGWQASLFPTGYSGITKIVIGDYRKKDSPLNFKNPTQGFKNLPEDMKKLLIWWNESPVGLDGVLRAGIAYFWFSTLQPFEDGNSLLGKHLVDLALAQDEKTPYRAYDLDRIFIQNEGECLQAVQACHEQSGDITLWLQWFLNQLAQVIDTGLEDQKDKSAQISFWKKTKTFDLNLRQKKIISYLLSGELSIPSSEVKIKSISNRACVQLCGTSRESIKRDLGALEKWGLLVRGRSQGRSVTYALNRN